MQDLIISINNNVLRLSTVDQEANLKTAVLKLSDSVVKDSKILDPAGLGNEIQSILSSVTDLDKPKLSLNFVIQPEEAYLRFVTVGKTELDIEAQIMKEIKEKLEDVTVDDLYYSYQKIAPFLYQFIGVKKENLESYLDVSNTLGIGLKSIIPWVLALPKYVKVNDPAIFVSKVEDSQIIALSELNGIFFSGVYEKEQSDEEIQKLVQDLSFYKRSTPINSVFTLNCDSFNLNGYKVIPITLPEFNDGSEIPSGFEQNVIANFLIDTRKDLLLGQLNGLNLLPLPVIEAKNTALVAVGGITAAVLLVGVLYGGFLLFNNKVVAPSGDLAHNSQEETSVLSETSVVEETQDSIVEVNRGDLPIRVENGTNTSNIASDVQTLLNDLGYKVLDVGTADDVREITLLRFKPDKLDLYKDVVSEDLKKAFPNIEIQETLDPEAEYDLLIIVGTSNNL